MKKHGILNAQLMFELTKLRHYDKMVICDAGLPIPCGTTVVDISLVPGIPTMLQTLDAVLNEVIFQAYTIFDSIKQFNPDYYSHISTILDKLQSSEISMPEFLVQAQSAKFFIRTGDMTPCANILLVSASGLPHRCAPLDITRVL